MAKSPLKASGRGNQPAGRLPESHRGCPGLNDNHEVKYNGIFTGHKKQVAELVVEAKIICDSMPLGEGVDVVDHLSKWSIGHKSGT